MIPYHGRQLLTISCGWSRLRSPDTLLISCGLLVQRLIHPQRPIMAYENRCPSVGQHVFCDSFQLLFSRFCQAGLV